MNNLKRFLVYPVLILSSTQVYAADCDQADDNLNLHISCLQVGADKVEANLVLSNFLVSGAFVWEVKDYGVISSTKQCDVASPELNFQLSCVQYAGDYYQVDFLSKFSSVANLGIFWELGAVVPVAKPEPKAAWVSYTHPCQENQTDAFWWDDDTTVWVGCGTGASGLGLWRSADGGKSWGQVNGFMETWRVNGIRRAADGRLYVAGTDTTSKNIVVSFDTSVTPYDAQLEFTRGTKISLSFTAEHIMVDSNGNTFTDSLTGAGSAYRTSGSDTWTGIDGGWASDGSSYQILDMVMFDDQIYGAGSTISEPPYIFLPAINSSEFYKMTPVDLSKNDPLNNVSGEMWGVAVLDASRVVSAGVDQDRNIGLIYASQSNPYDPTDYHKFDVSTILPNTFSWMRGVCALGNNVLAVGEKQPLSTGTGIALLSTDGGLSFKNITDPNITATTISRCQFLSNGRVAVAGSGGYVGIYTLSK